MTTKKPVSWNLTHLRACDDDPRIQQEFDEIRVSYSRFAEKWQANTSYLTSVDSLLEALVELEMLTETYGAIGKSGYYWILRGVQQQNHAKVKQMQAVTFALDSDISNKIEFLPIHLGGYHHHSRRYL